MLSKLLQLLLQLVNALLDFVDFFLSDVLGSFAFILSSFFGFVYNVLISAVIFLALLNLFVPVDVFFFLMGLWLAWRLRVFVFRLGKWLIEVIAP